LDTVIDKIFIDKLHNCIVFEYCTCVGGKLKEEKEKEMEKNRYAILANQGTCYLSFE
jgi:hypothetical protein